MGTCRMLARFLSVFVILAIYVPRAACVEPSDYLEQMAQLRRFCMGNLCLGMSLDEVERQGAVSWDGQAPPGNLNCYVPTSGIPATLPLDDGTKATLLFDVVTASGEPKSRYRLVSVSRRFPALGPAQIEHLRKTLTDRFGGMQQVPDAGDLWGGLAGSMRISVMSGWLDPSKRPPKVLPENWAGFLSLSATYARRADWTMAQAECKKGMPAL
jgi:hypothetical protein